MADNQLTKSFLIQAWKQITKIDNQRFVGKLIYPVSPNQYKYYKGLYEEGKMAQEEFDRYVENKPLPISYRPQQRRLPNNVKFKK